MSIDYYNGTRELLNLALELCHKPMSQIVMAEFGNQRLKFPPIRVKPPHDHIVNKDGHRQKRSSNLVAKHVFEFFGVKHVSFDLNGFDYAIKQDLSKPINAYQSEFDIVTNFGTLEHVAENQYIAFKNMHNLCKPGGIMVHCMPSNQCVEHGNWQYTMTWFDELARINRYTILYKKEWDNSQRHPIPPGTEIILHVILRKTFNIDFNEQWIDPIPAIPAKGCRYEFDD